MNTKIFDYGMNGEGVGKLDGKIILIPNTIVGETVDCDITSDQGNYATANLTNIIEKSENRIEPKCKHFYECGGCALQHMKYSEQLNFKRMLVHKTLKKIANIEYTVLPTIPSSNQYNYRNKVSFSVKDNNCGFLKSHSSDLIPIERCEIVDDRMNRISSLFSSYIEKNNIREVRNLVIRIINDQILVGVVASKKINIISFYDIVSKEFDRVGLFLVINKRNDSVVLTDNIIHLAGIKQIEVINNGIKYTLDILGFQQTNLDIQDKIYDYVLNNIETNEVIVNAFSGQGLLSATVSKKAKHVYGIEINKSSHAQAEKLKQDNVIHNLTNICGDFNKKISTIKDYNTIILDPSKKGCGKILEQIIANKIIYISCNPIALAKDLRLLTPKYSIESIQPFDMFPNTSSVETVVILKRNQWFHSYYPLATKKD